MLQKPVMRKRLDTFELPRGPAEQDKLLLSLHRICSGMFLPLGNCIYQVQPLCVSKSDWGGAQATLHQLIIVFECEP